MNAAGQRAKEIFVELIGTVPAEQWDQRLAKACGGDEELRRRVAALLRAHRDPDSFLIAPAVARDTEPTIDQPLEQPGTQIGPYKLLEQIGEGGMGTVFVAQQSEPLKRLVALKIIKPGMDSRQVIARFEAERQALALMDHPNIAKVLDAGTTGAGRPYFVMELVKGVPITQYCDQHHLTPKERLELFVPVCQAIQHAHQKGIIHRDLKPSNVLVALYDDQPVPKVIDFGVAKATGQQLTEQTLHTGFGAVVGTLEYMSPEQATFNQLDVDTRSDIYSLGVLLYELLAGSPPFSRQNLEQAGLLEMLRVIREQEPSKPSTKLSSSDALPTLSANRGTEPARLTKQLRGELDWIVMKALEKDRSRRYETANGLAMDLHRYLHDEPVLACPPSAAYRFRKFARRNKTKLIAASLVAAGLLLGLVGTTWQAIRATRAERVTLVQRDRALKAEKLAKDESQRASQEAQKAKTEAAIAQAVNDFLNQDLLGQANPWVPYDRYKEPAADLKLLTVLDRAAEKLEGRFADEPLVEAALRMTIGLTYLHLGNHDLAALHLTRAVELREAHLGEEDPNTLISMNCLVWATHDLDDATRVLDIHRRVLGKDHFETLRLMFIVALETRVKGERTGDKRYIVQAIELLRETLQAQRRALGEDDKGTAWTMHCLAHTLVMNAGKDGIAAADDREIESLYRRALAVRKNVTDWYTLDITVRLGEFLNSRGRYEEAETLLQDALRTLQSLPGAEPEMVARLVHELDSVYKNWGKPDRANQ